MRVSTLYPNSPLRDQDVVVLGLGPSLRAFPLKYLEGRTCVLLKDAWKHFPTLGPVAFSTASVYLDGCPLPLPVVKARHKGMPHAERDDNHVPWDHPRLYCYSYREPPWDPVSHHDIARLWAEPDHYWSSPGGSVALFAVQFAALCGARSIQLVGCDCGELGGREYLSAKVTKAREQGRIDLARLAGRKVSGKPSRDRHTYAGYRAGLAELAARCLKDRGIPVVTTVPFMGLFEYEQQFRALLEPKG